MGKNLIGAFHQPSLVACDPALLRSLPLRELRSGLGEVVKYGVVADAELFKMVEAQGEKLLEVDPSAIATVVKRCAAIKAQYVERDERDSRGVRVALNYGHTLGHAVETLSGHSVRHGEAVAVGMVAASKIALRLCILPEDDLERQVKALEGLGIKTVAPPIDVYEMLAVMRRDKKAEEGRIRFVLPTGIGTTPILKAIPESAIIEALEA
jgi:3-dehydroquinate synthase